MALPFLSYAAGLATAAEITKLATLGRVVTRNRIVFDFDPRTDLMVLPVTLQAEDRCSCRVRNTVEYKQIIQGSRFANLSKHRTSTFT